MGRFRIVVGQEVSDRLVRGVTQSKRAKRDLTQMLLLLAIHKSIMPHCATFNCSNDQQATVSLFRFPINDKKLLLLWLAALKTCRRPQTEYILITGREHSRLCLNHFSQESFTQNIEVVKSIGWSLKRLSLKPEAVPSVLDFQVRSHKENPKQRNKLPLRSI